MAQSLREKQALRAQFLMNLTANEDDTEKRLILSDLLEEMGEDDEAIRHRAWPAAKAWMLEFCKEHNYKAEDYGYTEEEFAELDMGRHIDYDELIRLGYETVGEKRYDRYSLHLGSSEKMCGALRAHRREFWTNWAILTGETLPDDFLEKVSISCAC